MVVLSQDDLVHEWHAPTGTHSSSFQTEKAALREAILHFIMGLSNSGGGGVDPIPCVSTHRISDTRSGPDQLLPPHVKQRSHPHGVRPQIPDR